MTSSASVELNSLGRLGVRGALLLLPFFILQLLELFVLPIDFFTFRVWEAALATPYRYPGAFYPNLHVRKAKEYSDRYRVGDPNLVQFKPVEWFVDAYGWRNRPDVERQDKYDIVVLGDSNIIGSFLDQKDTLSEALGRRAGLAAYSYSYGSDHISLYFSDPRMLTKAGGVLVVESKAGNWWTNADYLANFLEMPDGSLDVVDRTAEFSNNYYAPNRNLFLEKLESRLGKQAMFHSLKAGLSADFVVRAQNSGETFAGAAHPTITAGKDGWRPLNWVVAGGGSYKSLSDEPQPALKILGKGPNTYWHTERFVSSHPDAKIVVRFEARNSVRASRHRIYIFEDGIYRSVGEAVAGRDWRTFEIPIATKPGSILEFQIDQLDDWQWLSIRDVQVIGGQPPPLLR